MFEMLESKRVSGPGLAIQIALLVLGVIITGKLRTPWPLLAGVLIGLYSLLDQGCSPMGEGSGLALRKIQAPARSWRLLDDPRD